MRRVVFAKFFVIAPAGQGHFSSTTLLLFIADMLVQMTMGMYTEPQGMVEDDAALGLRHVGFGIPTVLLGPLCGSWHPGFALAVGFRCLLTRGGLAV